MTERIKVQAGKGIAGQAKVAELIKKYRAEGFNIISMTSTMVELEKGDKIVMIER